MIAYLNGNIVSKNPGVIIIDIGGLGYSVRVSNHTFDRLPTTGENCILHIHHHISENDQQLFGFASIEERNLFELLITVKSIGPRLALALLSSMPPLQVINAIVDQNPALIARSPGIGKKSAERIVLELSDKLGDIASHEEHAPEIGSIQSETVSALEALGYAHNQALKAVREAIDDKEPPSNVSELLKRTLKLL
ncbi:MAG: Holliday junction branch migration protein RuvA [Balneolales bacterium]